MKGGVIFILVFLLFINIFFVNAIVLHQASDFNMKIDGVEQTLQQAIVNSRLTGPHTSELSSLVKNPGHTADDVWVSVNGGESTLSEAILSRGLCSIIPSENYSNVNLTDQFHLASEIEISPGISLQTAINSEQFCECIPGSTKISDCDYLDSVCRNYDDRTYNCDVFGQWNNPSCPYTDLPKGTSCTSDDWHSCDGNGECLGWSGSNCASCPFGSQKAGDVRSYCTLNGNQGRAYIGGHWYSWSTDEDHAAICSAKVCCTKFIICWNWCWEDRSWQMKP